ncbi:MAG: rhomboid family intramembrane serine protease [Planctomycetota bacterium]|nr:rhomboid family intramembrane serine protease [Planctomycetota bacterium]
MGIHNRDYFRDDAPRVEMRSSGGFRSDGWAVKWIIGACVAMYFIQSATGQGVRGQLVGGATDLFALDLASLRNFELWRIFTYGLCHANIQHLLFNMIGVWVFGRMIESVYGPKETLTFFGVAVGLSGLAQIGVSALSTNGGFSGVVGASGGVLGLVTLAAMNFPRLPMQLLFIPVPIELRWLAAGYVGLDLYQVLGSHNGHVANFAHLGGAAVGILYFVSGIRIFPASNGSASRSRVSIGGVIAKLASKKKPDPRRAPEVKLYEPPSEALTRDVDRLLDKINREGKDSLTREENEILMKASESYRNRV